MKKHFFGITFLLATLLSVVVVIDSCKKKDADTDTLSSTDNSICENEFSRIFLETHGIAVGDSGVLREGLFPVSPNNACPDHWVADTVFPKTMWIQYGADTTGDGVFDYGCNPPGEKVRMGQIQATFSAPWGQSGSHVTITPMGYYVNGVKFEGTVDVTRNSATSFTQSVTNGKCSSGSDWTILWNSTRTLTVDVGDPFVQGDDVTTLSGTASGTDRNGKTFSVEITTPLRREMSCRWIVSGTMTVKLEGKKDRVVDFGDGTCDNRATVTIEGNVFEFALQ